MGREQTLRPKVRHVVFGRNRRTPMTSDQPETPELGAMPEYILAYIAPMQCGEKERHELLRRQRLGIATGDRLGITKRQ